MEYKVDGKTEFRRGLSPSGFKDLVMCWEFGRNSFHAAFGYSVLEILVKFKEKTQFVSKIWEFFERDEYVKKKAKDEDKFELFFCFKKLLTVVYLGNFINDVEELRVFLCSKKYWLASVEYYFKNVDYNNFLPVHILIYTSGDSRIFSYIEERAPLVLVCKKENEEYYPADLTEFELSDSRFPYEYHPGLDLSVYKSN
jgi:hypothetical protein